MRVRAFFGLGAVLVASHGACGDDTEEPPAQTGAVVRFELAGDALPPFLEVPFPSDVYLEADGTIIDDLAGLSTYVPSASQTVVAALGQLPGFGRTSGVMFRVDMGDAAEPALVDADSLPSTPLACAAETSSVLLIDLDADASELLVPCRASYQDDRALGSLTPPTLIVLPARGTVLREGHRYAAVVTSSLTSDGGKPVQASATFAAIRDGVKRATKLEAAYGEAVDAVLARAPFLAADPKRVVALTTFTTQASTHELFELRELVGSMAPPIVKWDTAAVAPMFPGFFTKDPTPGATATLDEWLGEPRKLDDGSDDPAADQPMGHGHDALLAIATGVFEAPNFLIERADGYDDPQHRTFARDSSGAVIVNPEMPSSKIWVSIAIPDKPMPANGFPIVVLQHGLQGDRSFLLTMANTFAKEGYASVAIEAVTFGARAAEPKFHTDEISRFPWSGSAGHYAGPDGLVDENANAIALFGGLVNFSASRDQFRQSVVDFGTLSEILADEAIDLGPLATLSPGLKLDGTRLAYIGDSFGSVLGSLVASVDPRYRAMILNVGGGGILVELVSNGPLLGTIIGSLGGLTFGLTKDRLDFRHPLVNLLQPILDAADPLSYADFLVRQPVTIEATGVPKSIIIVEVLWDELISNEGTEALASAAGIPLAEPNVGENGGMTLERASPVGGEIRDVPDNGRTLVVVQASPGTHGSNLYGEKGVRAYAPPFVRDVETGLFTTLPSPIEIRQPYLGLQDMAVAFIRSAFEDETPVVLGFPTPIRDFDDDGVVDEDDAEPWNAQAN